MPEDHFGEEVAAHYDEDESGMFDPAVVERTVDFLAALAGSGPVLELGIGTGRIALPLSARGVRVHGVDLSEAMLERLRAKPGAERIELTVGDFATTRAGEGFTLAYLIFNTIKNLTSQEEQLACFQSVASQLGAGGLFVIEVNLPALRQLPPGQSVRPFEVGPAKLGFDEYDVATQRLVSHHFTLREGAWELVSMPFRYVWPSELDLMARMAGLTLRERWGDWSREPFTGESPMHVSVWEKAGS